MRGILRLVPILVLILACTSAGQDFNFYSFSIMDYDMRGSGPRARAMGGAFIGVADDASALTWNPAGLVQVDRIQTSISGIYAPLEQKTAYGFSSATNNLEEIFEDEKFKPSFASFVAPLRIKGHPFIASVSYQSGVNILDGHSSWIPVEYDFTRFDTLAEVDANLHYEHTGGLDAVNIGFGTGLYGDLSIGAALTVYDGTSNVNYRASFIDTLPLYFSGQLVDSVEVVLGYSAENEISHKGISVKGSLFYQTEKFRVGATVSPPWEMINDHDYSIRDTLYENSLPTFPSGELARLFRAKTKIEFPLTVAGGISYKLKDNFLLAADFELRRWSQSKYFIERDTLFTHPGGLYFPDSCAANPDGCEWSHLTSSGDKIEVFDEFDLGFQNSVDLRFGGEYLMETSVGVIPLRGGFRYTLWHFQDVTDLTRDEFDQPQAGFNPGDRLVSQTFSFGTGIHWRQIWLDGSFEFTTLKQEESGSGTFGDYTAEREKNYPSVRFGFTGFF